MTASDVRLWYFALDSDHDISGDELALSLDGATYVPAAAVAAPTQAVGLDDPPAGLTRYWWRLLIGPCQQLVPDPDDLDGLLTVFGRLTDTPEILHPVWRLEL